MGLYPFDEAPDRTGTGSLKWDRYRGRDVIPLWVADMDFKSPPEVIAALLRRVEHGVFGYTIPYAEVIEETLAYLRRRHGIEARPDWLVWLPGLVPALNLLCRAFCAPGEAVMTCTPVYPPFLSAPVNQERKRIAVPLRLEGDHWGFDWAAMEAAVTPQTRLFILCHPHNPVGRVWRRGELETLLDFCERHDLVLVSDEIHCDLILDDHVPWTPTLVLGERAAGRTITLHSPSKTFNLPGLACAYAVIPNDRLRATFQRACRGIVTEINAFGYAGCAAAYRFGEPWRQELIAYLRANRDLLYSFAKEHLPRILLRPMEATYLAWLDVRGLGVEHPHRFFEEAGVGLSNGVDFGAPGFLRLNFGCPRSRLESALERMARALRAVV
ncbi:MAG: PatB family C-S lyase [Kiritimatiellae bacterium]|nr:PatB family C-S lyase [Kiritimatiellia bacterium]MDW8459474.1 PatB family C-S lyase [Verrucomicrobiota bacterium]